MTTFTWLVWFPTKSSTLRLWHPWSLKLPSFERHSSFSSVDDTFSAKFKVFLTLVFLLWPFLGCGLRWGEEMELGRRRLNLGGDSSLEHNCELFNCECSWFRFRLDAINSYSCTAFRIFLAQLWQTRSDKVVPNSRAEIGLCVTILDSFSFRRLEQTYSGNGRGFLKIAKLLLQIDTTQSAYITNNSFPWLRAAFCRFFWRIFLLATGNLHAPSRECLWSLHLPPFRA